MKGNEGRRTALARKRGGLKLTPFLVWVVGLLALAALGAVAILYGFWRGHESVYNASRWMPWGVLISTYVFFAVSASGMCLISSLGHVFHMERYEPLARRAVFFAMISLVAGFWALAGDLERPWRLPIWAVLTPGFSSAIWWMGVLYGLYLVVLIVEFFYLSRAEMLRRSPVSINPSSAGSQAAAQQRLKKSKSFAWFAGIGGFVLAIAAPGTLGAVFGVVKASYLWYGAYMPVYFILSALVSGAALLALVIILTYKLGGKEIGAVRGLVLALGKLLLVFLALFLLFTAWRIVAGLYGSVPGKVDAAQFLVNGRLGLSFWVFEMFLGLFVPLIILLIPKTRTLLGVGLAAFLVMIGMFVARYDFVAAGQLTSAEREAQSVSLMPSPTEMIVVLGAFALFAALYLIGNRFLPLSEHSEAGSRQ